MDATHEAVRLLDVFCQNCYDVADALAALAEGDARRNVPQSEFRFALARLDAGRPLPQANLVDCADLSRSSTYTHLLRLEALGLVEKTPEDHRLAVAFHTEEDRNTDHLPGWMDEQHTETRDVLYDAAVALVDDASRAGDPADSVFGLWLDPPDEAVTAATAFADTWPWVARWGPLVAGLLRTVPPDRDDAVTPAAFGADLDRPRSPRVLPPLGTPAEPTGPSFRNRLNIGIDHRDETVLRALTSGRRTPGHLLCCLYRKETDVRTDNIFKTGWRTSRAARSGTSVGRAGGTGLSMVSRSMK